MIVTCAACGRKAAATPETKEVVCDCGHIFDPAARPTVADPFLGQELAGYRIEEVIGSGGMGTVYRATQLSLNRAVAVKVLPERVADDPQFVKRFHREAQILAALAHPNIVQVFDRGEVDGRYFIVMEFVEGESLRNLMKRGPVPPKQACKIIAGLLDALDYAHEQAVIHRDIKPENVLVSDEGIVKIADFGLSRVVSGDDAHSRLTHTHLVLGTYEYMAPEQRESAQEADTRADIYATAVVFYELLTGELPIGRFDMPSSRLPGIDRRVDDIIDRGLAKNPEHRYERASAMGREVASLISSPEAPVDIEKLRPFRRVRGKMRRHETPRVRMPSSYEMRLDLLLTVLSVCGIMALLIGAGLLFGVGPFERVLDADDRGIAGVGLLMWGFLMWNSAERARKHWPGARTSLLALTLLAVPTMIAIPITIWTWVTLLSPGMRAFYHARYRGLDAVQAAAVAGGLAAPPVRKRYFRRLFGTLLKTFALVAFVVIVLWRIAMPIFVAATVVAGAGFMLLKKL